MTAKPVQKSHKARYRKPAASEQVQPHLIAEDILARQAFWGGLYLNQGCNWKPLDEAKLRVLCDAGADVEKSAAALGRQPKTLAYRANDLGIVLPDAWKLLLPKPKYIAKPREKSIIINYPFVIKARDEHGDLLAVNAIVSKKYPNEMRGDICQEILLDVYEGKMDWASLRGPRGQEIVRQYATRWRKDNMERGGYGIMSLNPLEDDRSYDEVAGSIAAREWDWHERNQKQKTQEAFSRTFHAPTQIEDVYEKEVRGEYRRLQRSGEHLSYEEFTDHLKEREREDIDKFRAGRFILTE